MVKGSARGGHIRAGKSRTAEEGFKTGHKEVVRKIS